MMPRNPAKERHSRITYFALRPEERRQVERIAAAEGVSMSAIIRRAVLKALRNGHDNNQRDE